MSKRPNVVLVIVEGPTEELALGLVFSQLFRAMGRLHFEVVHGDLLTQQRFCVTPGDNAESKRVDEWVRKGILDYLKDLSPKITWNDLACVRKALECTNLVEIGKPISGIAPLVFYGKNGHESMVIVNTVVNAIMPAIEHPRGHRRLGGGVIRVILHAIARKDTKCVD